MTGALSVIGGGTSLQPMVGLLFQTTYLLVVLKASPYLSNEDDIGSFVTSLTLVVTMLCALVLFTDSQTDSGHASFDRDAVGSLMMVLAISCLVVEVVLMVHPMLQGLVPRIAKRCGRGRRASGENIRVVPSSGKEEQGGGKKGAQRKGKAQSTVPSNTAVLQVALVLSLTAVCATNTINPVDACGFPTSVTTSVQPHTLSADCTNPAEGVTVSGAGADMTVEGAGHVVTKSTPGRHFTVSGGAHLVLRKITLTGGGQYTDEHYQQWRAQVLSSGGIVLVYGAGSVLKVEDSVLKSGSAFYGGCVAAREESRLIMSGTVVEDCSNPGGNSMGGGVLLTQSRVEIRSSTIRNNNGNMGGGIYFGDWEAYTASDPWGTGDVVVENVRFIDNTARGNGGGLYGGFLDWDHVGGGRARTTSLGVLCDERNRLRLSNCTFQGNWAQNEVYGGG